MSFRYDSALTERFLRDTAELLNPDDHAVGISLRKGEWDRDVIELVRAVPFEEGKGRLRYRVEYDEEGKLTSISEKLDFFSDHPATARVRLDVYKPDGGVIVDSGGAETNRSSEWLAGVVAGVVGGLRESATRAGAVDVLARNDEQLIFE
ncbi:MAG: hypothetical protein AAB909_01880 [Patescibacteria group bacterium]